MGEDALSKAKRYRKAASRYIELAEQAEPGYLAEVYRAAQYLSMAEDLLIWAERPRGRRPRSEFLAVVLTDCR